MPNARAKFQAVLAGSNPMDQAAANLAPNMWSVENKDEKVDTKTRSSEDLSYLGGKVARGFTINPADALFLQDVLHPEGKKIVTYKEDGTVDRSNDMSLPTSLQQYDTRQKELEGIRNGIIAGYQPQTDISPLMALSDTWFGGNQAKEYKAPETLEQNRLKELAVTKEMLDATKDRGAEEMAYLKTMLSPTPTEIEDFKRQKKLDNTDDTKTIKGTTNILGVKPADSAGQNIDKKVRDYADRLEKTGASNEISALNNLSSLIPGGVYGWKGEPLRGVGGVEAVKNSLIVKGGTHLLNMVPGLENVGKENLENSVRAKAFQSALENFAADIRHGLFGASLTGGEKESFLKIADNPSLSSDAEIIAQIKLLMEKSKNKVRNLEAGSGPDVVAKYKSMYGEGAPSSSHKIFSGSGMQSTPSGSNANKAADQGTWE